MDDADLLKRMDGMNDEELLVNLSEYTEIPPRNRVPATTAKGQLLALLERFSQWVDPWLNQKPKLTQRQRDSVQISVTAVEKLSVSKWGGSVPPMISGLTRVYAGFRPEKLIVTETLRAFYAAKKLRGKAVLPDVSLVESVSDCSDLIMVAAFAGVANCFPNAPTVACGISGEALVMMTEISWPAIQAGQDFTMTFAVEETALVRMTNHKLLPKGYDPIPYAIEAEVRANFFGPRLR